MSGIVDNVRMSLNHRSASADDDALNKQRLPVINSKDAVFFLLFLAFLSSRFFSRFSLSGPKIGISRKIDAPEELYNSNSTGTSLSTICSSSSPSNEREGLCLPKLSPSEPRE